MHKLLINLTPTGMIPTRDMSPHVPLSVDEIVEDVLECVGLGASIVHLHAREADGSPSYRKELYGEMIRRIRAGAEDVVICVSTSGRVFNEVEKRGDVLDLDGAMKPDMASLTLGSLNFARTASINAPQTIEWLAAKMHERGIKPELEVFDLGMINYAKYLIRKGKLHGPHYFNLLFGNIATAQADLVSIGRMIQELPEDAVWSLGGIGNCQKRVTSLAIAAGGGVRIGLEDNIYFDEERTILATNAMLIKRVVATAQAMGVEIARAADVRAQLGLDSMRDIKAEFRHAR